MCPGSSNGRAPALKAGDLGSNPGPGVNFSLNINLHDINTDERIHKFQQGLKRISCIKQQRNGSCQEFL